MIRLPQTQLRAHEVAKEGLRSGLDARHQPDPIATATPKPAFTFSYELSSNLSAVTIWSAAGVATGTTCLIHDALNRLTTVGPALALESPGNVAFKTDADLASVTVRFKYDARNAPAAAWARSCTPSQRTSRWGAQSYRSARRSGSAGGLKVLR